MLKELNKMGIYGKKYILIVYLYFQRNYIMTSDDIDYFKIMLYNGDICAEDADEKIDKIDITNTREFKEDDLLEFLSISRQYFRAIMTSLEKAGVIKLRIWYYKDDKSRSYVVRFEEDLTKWKFSTMRKLTNHSS